MNNDEIFTSTTDTIPCYEIKQSLGVIFSKALIGNALQRALDDLILQCRNFGGNAVVGIKFSSLQSGGILAYGTAVIVEK